MPVETVLPSQVFAAIEYAKKQDPKDKFGDGAFRMNVSNIRPGKNNVRYAGWEILKHRPNGVWEFVPVNLKYMNLQTKSKIHPPGHPKKKYAGVTLQFRVSSSFKTKAGEEPYGKAKVAIYSAFKRITMRMLKAKEIFHGVPTIKLGVQTERKVDEKTGKTEKLDDGIIRVSIPFKALEDGPNSKIDLNEKPKCEIYDATKKVENPKKDEVPYQLATLKDKEGKDQPLVYQNVGDFILPGSTCTGVDCMDSVTFSQQGISLPSKASLLIVKPSKGYKPDVMSVFGNDFSEIENAETGAPEAEGDDGEGDDATGTPAAAAVKPTEADLTDGVEVDGLGEEDDLGE